jgi:hypothetical protein
MTIWYLHVLNLSVWYFCWTAVLSVFLRFGLVAPKNITGYVYGHLVLIRVSTPESNKTLPDCKSLPPEMLKNPPESRNFRPGKIFTRKFNGADTGRKLQMKQPKLNQFSLGSPRKVDVDIGKEM